MQTKHVELNKGAEQLAIFFQFMVPIEVRSTTENTCWAGLDRHVFSGVPLAGVAKLASSARI